MSISWLKLHPEDGLRPKLRHRFHEVAQSCLMFHFEIRAAWTFATP
jgi:hypothetical protein